MKPTSAISLLYVPSSRSTNYLCLANFWCFKKNSSRVLKTKMTTLFNRSRRKQTQKPPFLVKCILCSSWTKWEQMTWKKIIWPSLKVWNLLSIGRGLHFFHTLNEEQLNYSTQHTKWYRKVAWSVVLYHLKGLLLK